MPNFVIPTGGAAGKTRFMMARCLLATLAVLFALSASAQTPERSSAEAIEALSRGADLMGFTMSWRYAASDPDEKEMEEQYKETREATALFMRFADERFIAMAMEGIRYWFDDVRRHDTTVVVPRTIEEAVQECHERHDRQLTVGVARTLADALEHAWQDKMAEAKYGPIVDNPEYYHAIRSPLSGLDLLKNVKWAIDHDALLRIDFFTSENMKRFFGISTPVFRNIASTEATWLSSSPQDANPQTGCSFQIVLYYFDGGTQSAILTVDCNGSHSVTPTFDDVVRTYGEDWRREPTVPPEGTVFWALSSQPEAAVRGVHRPPPMGPQGYDNLVYVHRAPHFSRMLTVFLGDDASFKRLHLDVTDWP